MPSRGSPSQAGAAVGSGLRFGRGLPMGPTIHFAPSLGIVAKHIDTLNVDIRSFRKPLHDAIKEVMIPSIRRNFDEEGRPPWEPLSEFTLLMRERQGTGSTILDATGRLKRKATQLNLWDITSTSAVVRNIPQEVWYGKVHQAGYGSQMDIGNALRSGKTMKQVGTGLKNIGKVGGGRTSPDIPARPFLVFQPEDEEAIKVVFVKWLTERVIAFTRW